jgi:hypothetical protein
LSGGRVADLTGQLDQLLESGAKLVALEQALQDFCTVAIAARFAVTAPSPLDGEGAVRLAGVRVEPWLR